MDLPEDLYRAPPFKLKGQVNPLGHVDVAAIRERLSSKTREDWLENSLRQQQFKVHKDTESLVLKWSANNGTDTPVETTRHWVDFEPLLQPVLEIIQNAYRYAQPIIRKAMFAKLKAGGEISAHMDGAVALRMVHRIHIPIVTNERVHFYIDDIDHRFNVGDVVEIDNTKYHSVRNNGAEDRIHLIVDYYHA
jgi:hypothetical protein